jgi:hypothetical protein
MQNTVDVTYRPLSGPGAVRLEIRPSINFRSHDDGENATFTVEGGTLQEMFYRLLQHRPHIRQGRHACGLSTHSWKIISALRPKEAVAAEIDRKTRLIAKAEEAVQMQPASELVLAADQFIANPIGRRADLARANAAGDELRTVVAGYHWFTDWGRDTMIGLEGLTLTTRRCNQARWILRTFFHYIKNGLIPNHFPEGERWAPVVEAVRTRLLTPVVIREPSGHG